MSDPFDDEIQRALDRRAAALTVTPRSPAPTPASGRRVGVLVGVALLAVLVGVGLVWFVVADDEATVETRDESEIPSTSTSTSTSTTSTTTTSGIVVEGSSDERAPGVTIPASEPYLIPGTDIWSLDLPMTADRFEGLADGDEVRFRVDGVTPDAQVGVVQCLQSEPRRGRDDCDLGTVVFAVADADGLVEGTFVVRRFINTVLGTVDCVAVQAVTPCGLGVGNPQKLEESGNLELFFATDSGGEAPPRIDVSETQDLVHGQVVEVAGTGFLAGELVWLLECAVTGEGDAGCFSGHARVRRVSVGDDGTFVASIPAYRIAGTGADAVDCADEPERCVVAVQANRPPNTVALTFDATLDAPVERSLLIEPTSQLEVGTPIQISVAGMGSGLVTVEVCSDVTVPDCVELAASNLVDGATTLSVPAPGVVDGPDLVVDCSLSGVICSLQVRGEGIVDQGALLSYRGDFVIPDDVTVPTTTIP